jgi:hypothetical protein
MNIQQSGGQRPDSSSKTLAGVASSTAVKAQK